jgi:hypothetical protein
MPMPDSARSDFRIDPALAKALQDDQRRLEELRRSRGYIGAPQEEEANDGDNWWRHEAGVIGFQNEVIKYLYYRVKY